MAQYSTLDLAPEIGIQRDGTAFDSNKFNAGSWTRFYKGRAQKMGGYTIINNGTDEIVRNVFSLNIEGKVIVYLGRSTGLQYLTIDADLVTTTAVDVTPSGFNPGGDPNYTWSFATVAYNSIDYILALPALNGADISNTTPGQLYYGIVGDPNPLQPVNDITSGDPIMATGGVTVAGNYILVYGSSGNIFWNDGATITGWPTANIVVFQTSKFVYGAPVRSGPTLSALFWSLDFVAQLSLNTDTPPTFQSSYVSTQSTLLSANAIVSFDPFFYWPGNNTFYQFNASVMELQNTTNKEWFFNNLNRNNKEKVYGFVNRIYNEVWFLFPYGDSTENTNACIYSIDNSTWFDTDQIPRSCAVPSSTEFPYPIMCSSKVVKNGSADIFPIWAHEYGKDKVQLGQTIAIKAQFETNWISARDQQTPSAVLNIDTLIPDIQLTGNMSVVFNNRAYPNSPAVTSDPFVITPATEFLTVRQKASIFSATLTSNVVGGSFLFGKTQFLVTSASDERPGPATT